MELHFIWINGINRVDTLHFDSIEERNAYMAQGETYKVVTNSFYPPHTKLKLRVDVEDVDTDVECNYLSFEYKDRWYYYFITSFRYVNESVLEYSLDMDTFMTYYFDIAKISGVLERNTIKRWNGSSINRDYIRENVSNSNTFFSLSQKQDSIDDVVVDLVFWGVEGASCSVTGYKDKYTIPFIILFVPRSKTSGYFNSIQIVKSATRTDSYTMPSHYTLYNDGKTNFVLASIPISNFVGESYTVSYTQDNLSILTIYETSQLISTFEGYAVGKPPYLATYNMVKSGDSNKIIFTTEFQKNTNAKAIRDWRYCPYLCDSNYIRCSYGEKDNLKIAKIEYYTNTDHIIYFTHEIGSGSRLYYIDSLENVYRDLNLCTSSRDLDVAATSWNQYISRNRTSLITSSALNTMNGIIAGMYGNIGGVYSSATQGINTLSTIKDLQNSPTSVQMSSTIGQSIAMNATIPILYKEYVSDITSCMNVFENFGVKIDKTINHLNLESFYNRTYFDYIKMSSVDVSLHCLTSEEIKSDLQERLLNGVRIWHYKNLSTIGVYNYDNLEYSW